MLTLSGTPDLHGAGIHSAGVAGTGLLFGLVPALQATRPQLASTLKDQAAAVVHGPSVALRKSLVVVQVALSLLLLIGAGLFLQSLRNLHDLNPGFDTNNLLTFDVEPTLSGYSQPWTRDYYRRLKERLESLPGVSSVALAVVPVLVDNEWDNWVTIEGYAPKPGETPDPAHAVLLGGLFRDHEDPDSAGPLIPAEGRRERAQSGGGEPEIRQAIFRQRESHRPAHRDGDRSGDQDRNRNRRRGRRYQVRKPARTGAGGALHSVPAGGISSTA